MEMKLVLYDHLLLAKSSRNTLFEMIIESIMNVTKSILQSVNPERAYFNRVLDYHKEIYKGLKEKKLNIAKEKMRDHLLDANRKISELNPNPT